MNTIASRPLKDIALAIQNKEIRATQLVRDFLDRIEQVNGKLNAVVCSNAEEALKLAAKADDDLSKGILHGPLHGIPMTIKDSLDTSDTVTTWGTQGRENFQPSKDATCVARLRDAGAILLGKTNTPEFTLAFQTDNLVYGATKNPFDITRTPGGSSGGAAAIIAAGASIFDIGTDTGGSIRLPAHFCGIAGLKPTTGRVPCTGNALPSHGLIAPLSQAGPLARCVLDLDYLLNIIAGPDLIDPYAVPAPLHDMDKVDVSKLSIGYHIDNGIKTPSKQIQTTIMDLIDLIRERGMSAKDARPPGLEMGHLILNRVFTADGGDLLYALLDDARTTTPSKGIEERLGRAGAKRDPAEFAQTITLWDNYRSSMLGYFEDYDILICPVNATTAIALGEEEDFSGYTYTSNFNLSGWPGVVIRAGTDDKGLPIGVQILARPFREDHCLALAKWLEDQLGPFDSPQIYCQAK